MVIYEKTKKENEEGQTTLTQFYEETKKENEDGVRCVAFGGQWL